MECRRCGRELPVGQGKTCPFCGIYLDTIITPRGPAGKSKRTGNRATLMTFLSVGLVVAVVAIVIPFMRGVNKENMLASMEEAFEELNGRESAFSPEEWEVRLTSFSAAVENFEKAYPSDEEHIIRVRRYLDILCGIDPDTGEAAGPSEQETYNERLILRARDEIIDIPSLAFSKPDASGKSALTVQVRNSSDKFIRQVVVLFKIYDADGNPSNGSPRGDNEWYPSIGSLLPGEDKSFFFSEPWSDAGAAAAKIEWINVVYSDRDPIFFPAEVCQALWP